MIDNQELTSKELDAHKGDDLNNKIENCPCCDGRAELKFTYPSSCRISCTNCFTSTRWVSESNPHDHKPRAIAIWNARANSAQLKHLATDNSTQLQEQLTQTQQKLDVAVEALERVGALTKSQENDYYFKQNACEYNEIAEAALNTIGATRVQTDCTIKPIEGK